MKKGVFWIVFALVILRAFASIGVVSSLINDSVNDSDLIEDPAMNDSDLMDVYNGTEEDTGVGEEVGTDAPTDSSTDTSTDSPTTDSTTSSATDSTTSSDRGTNVNSSGSFKKYYTIYDYLLWIFIGIAIVIVLVFIYLFFRRPKPSFEKRVKNIGNGKQEVQKKV